MPTTFTPVVLPRSPAAYSTAVGAVLSQVLFCPAVSGSADSAQTARSSCAARRFSVVVELMA